MIQRVKTLYFHQQDQYNITETDQEPLHQSSHNFNTKFIKELNFQQNCQKKIERRIRQINNMKSIKQAIYEKFINKHQQDNLDTAQIVGSEKSHSINQKQFSYKGNMIKGRLRRRMLNGDTTILYKNGKQFQGLFQNGRMKAGKFDFKNGYEYWGELSGKQFFGKGTLKCPDGKRITGVWRSQHILGRAQIQYPSGDVYYGEVENFMKHGKGYLFFKTGNKYIGDFKNGEINGYGAYFQTDGKVLKGLWKNGELIKEEDEDSQEQDAIINVAPLQSEVQSKLNFFQSDFVLVSEVLDFQRGESQKI